MSSAQPGSEKCSQDNIAEELNQVGQLIGTCVDTTEKEFCKIKSTAKDKDDLAWAQSQLLLQKSKRVIHSLLRRQRSAVALYAASQGIQEDEPALDAQQQAVYTIQSPNMKTKMPMPQPPLPFKSSGESLSKKHFSTFNLSPIPEGDPAGSEGMNPSLVSLNSPATEETKPSRGQDYASRPRPTPENSSSFVFKSTPPKEQVSESTTAEAGNIKASFATPGKDFDRMISKITAGYTPNVSPVDQNTSAAPDSFGDLDGLLEFIGASPTPKKKPYANKQTESGHAIFPRQLFPESPP